MDDIDWALFDIGSIPLRRCSLCHHQAKFDASATGNYRCARLKQWTSPMFECPFWEVPEDWREWYAHCTALRVQKS
jgi:hypothetical protein